MKKFAVAASAATALVCAVALVATPVEAKRKAKKPEAAPAASQTYARPADYHDLGGPVRNGGQCWKDKDPAGNTGQGYWGKC